MATHLDVGLELFEFELNLKDLFKEELKEIRPLTELFFTYLKNYQEQANRYFQTNMISLFTLGQYVGIFGRINYSPKIKNMIMYFWHI